MAEKKGNPIVRSIDEAAGEIRDRLKAGETLDHIRGIDRLPGTVDERLAHIARVSAKLATRIDAKRTNMWELYELGKREVIRAFDGDPVNYQRGIKVVSDALGV